MAAAVEESSEVSIKTPGSSVDGLGNVVASHYNNIQELGINARKDSRLVNEKM